MQYKGFLKMLNVIWHFKLENRSSTDIEVLPLLYKFFLAKKIWSYMIKREDLQKNEKIKW